MFLIRQSSSEILILTVETPIDGEKNGTSYRSQEKWADGIEDKSELILKRDFGYEKKTEKL